MDSCSLKDYEDEKIPVYTCIQNLDYNVYYKYFFYIYLKIIYYIYPRVYIFDFQSCSCIHKRKGKEEEKVLAFQVRNPTITTLDTMIPSTILYKYDKNK